MNKCMSCLLISSQQWSTHKLRLTSLNATKHTNNPRNFQPQPPWLGDQEEVGRPSCLIILSHYWSIHNLRLTSLNAVIYKNTEPAIVLLLVFMSFCMRLGNIRLSTYFGTSSFCRCFSKPQSQSVLVFVFKKFMTTA